MHVINTKNRCSYTSIASISKINSIYIINLIAMTASQPLDYRGTSKSCRYIRKKSGLAKYEICAGMPFFYRGSDG